jgi:unspecific monooxygenase
MTEPLWVDPYPAFAELRETAPIYIDAETGHLVLTRYDDVRFVLRDAAFGMSPEAIAATAEPLRDLGRAYDYFVRRLHHYDPPDHTRLRSVLAPAFHAAAMGVQRAAARRTAETIAATLARRPFDVVSDYAEPFTCSTLTALIGVDPELTARVPAWLAGLADLLEPVATRERSTVVDDAWQAIAAALRSPASCPVGSVMALAAEASGRDCDEDEAVASVLFVLSAGHRTVRDLVCNAVIALLAHASWADLAADRSLAPAFVDECLRFDGPVLTTFRRALVDTEIGGVRVAKGTFITCVLGAADRDPSVFPEPDRLCPGRSERSVAFGGGVHFCLGAPLGRVLCEEALASLAAARPDLHVIEPVERRPSVSFRGPQAVLVR